jgi:hypothetical protein
VCSREEASGRESPIDTLNCLIDEHKWMSGIEFGTSEMESGDKVTLAAGSTGWILSFRRRNSTNA